MWQSFLGLIPTWILGEERAFKPWTPGSNPSRLTTFSTTYGHSSVSQALTFAPCSAYFVYRFVY